MPFVTLNEATFLLRNKTSLLLRNKKIFILVIILSLLPIIYFKGQIINFLRQNSLLPSAGYLCPTQKSFCESGVDIMEQGVYLGMGGNLSYPAQLVAVFDGDLKVSTITLPSEEKIIVASIDSSDQKTQAIYLYKGDKTYERKVKKGMVIGKSLEKISAYNTSLLFQIIKPEISKTMPIHITNQEFN